MLIVTSVATLGVGAGAIGLALRGSGGDHSRAAPAAAQLVPPAPAPAPAPAPPAPAPPAPAPAPTRSDPSAALAVRMKAVLGRFSVWSSGHAGAPCPDEAALGGDTSDSWGHPFVLTCTGQPENQIVGLVSDGPDGVNGNDDDVASWQLGHDVTDLVRGSRWAAAPARAAAPLR